MTSSGLGDSDPTRERRKIELLLQVLHLTENLEEGEENEVGREASLYSKKKNKESESTERVVVG